MRDTALTGKVYAFESVAEGAGDISRTRRHDYYALALAEPVCVPGHAKVDLLELRVAGRKVQALIGQEVTVTGALAAGGGARDQTEVVMKVRRVQPAASAAK